MRHLRVNVTGFVAFVGNT